MKIVKHKFDSLLSHSYENEFRLIVLYKRVLRLRNFEEPPLFRLRNWNVKRIYILLCIYSVIRNINLNKLCKIYGKNIQFVQLKE